MTRNNVATRAVILALLGLFYIGFVQKYRAYDVDNPWFLSFSYNSCHGSIDRDEFAKVRYPNGMDGVHLFGKAAAATQCLVLNRAGWTPTAVVGLNLVFVIASLWFWWSLLRRLGYREAWVAVFITYLGFMEPIVSMAEKARYEVFAFFLLSTALWLAVQGLEFAAVLLALLAVEIEPVALSIPIVVGLFLALRTQNRLLLFFKSTLAALISVVFYLKLHPGAIQEMMAVPPGAQAYIPGGTVYTYFIEQRRHLPEFVMLLVGGWIAWTKRQEMQDRTVLWLAAAMLAIFIFGLHPNHAYMVFVMPFLLWAAFDGYDRRPGLRWIPGTVFLGILFQYGYLYSVNFRDGFRSEDFTLVNGRIADIAMERSILKSGLSICGDYSLWFAHPKNYSMCTVAHPEAISGHTLYLCFDRHLMENGLSETGSARCSDIKSSVSVREISSMDLRGHLLHFYLSN